ncbi:hypothetical protein ACFQO4_13675 [Saliphagus sp. GCM10025334]
MTAERGVFEDELSIVEFLRRVQRREEIPLDVTVYGLDQYFDVCDDPEAAAEYVHTILRDRVNYILNQSPVIQFVVENVEHWEGAVLPLDDTDIRLRRIFSGSFQQEAPGWYAGEFNVQS